MAAQVVGVNAPLSTRPTYPYVFFLNPIRLLPPVSATYWSRQALLDTAPITSCRLV